MNKFLAPLLQAAVLLLGGVQLALADGRMSTLEAAQLASLALGAVVTFLVPLTGGPWPGILKTAATALGAGVALLIEWYTVGVVVWDASAIMLVALAVLNGLLTEIGTGVRLDSVSKVLSNPNIPDSVAASGDGAAYDVILSGRHLGR